MKEAYINCLKQLRNFRKILKIDKDIKRGKLYFNWIKDKKEIIECLEYELTELNKQQRDFIRYLNDSYGAFLDEKSPPIDLNDLFDDVLEWGYFIIKSIVVLFVNLIFTCLL